MILFNYKNAQQNYEQNQKIKRIRWKQLSNWERLWKYTQVCLKSRKLKNQTNETGLIQLLYHMILQFPKVKTARIKK